MLTDGDVLDGRYEITALIGTGGMGAVFRARRSRLGDEVAVKVIRSSVEGDPDIRERFMAEGRTCASLRHPNIVSVLDFGVDPERGPFLVMEYLNGPSLAQEIARSGPLPLEKVCRITADLASALDLAHAQGLIHRDLKPANVVTHRFETGDVVYKIVDFGIGIIRGRPGDTTRRDMSAPVLGSLSYASPEQLNGETLDGRSDIYSLGIVVFEMLTGRPPFTATDTMGVLTKQLTAAPPPPRQFRPQLAAHVDVAVLTALSKSPAHRWQTATDLARALAGLEVEHQKAPPPRPSALLERYDLGELIAAGRLGSEVYAGTHRAIGSKVAIRVMRRGSHPAWDVARARFLREARTMQVLHPSILQVRDFGEERDLVYIVTDFVPGLSLREILDRDGRLTWPRGRRLVHDLIGASHALHRRGALTFGLTPSIIRVTEDDDGERLVISSAGIAEIQDVLATESEEALRGRQVPDADLFYVAPELLLEEKPDGRTDIYTIGAIAYEMFTGRRPFTATTVPQLMAQMFSGNVADPRLVSPDLPVDAAHIIVRCLARRPDQRYADAAELDALWLATPD